VILISTDTNQLSGTIPTEIGQVTVLLDLHLCKYDGCLRCFHALFFMYSYILSSFLRRSLSIHQQHHRHSSPLCPLFVILFTTALNSLSGLIPTEIGQLTELTYLNLCEYDKCFRRFHALF
jgi:hypothetical protein